MKITKKLFLFWIIGLWNCSHTTPPPHVASTTTEAPISPPAAAVEAPNPTLDPEGAKTLVQKAQAIQREKGESGANEAIDKYLEALEKDPQCKEALWELGWSHQVLAEWQQAKEAWDALKEIDANFPELDKHYPVLELRAREAEKIAALPDPGVLPDIDLEPQPGPILKFRGVGDIQMGRAWPTTSATLPPNDAADFFDEVAPLLKDADLTFGNLETVLADTGDSTKCGPKSTKCFAFRVPTKFATPLKNAGFDILSIANNHAGDFGQEGRVSTMRALDGVGIKHSGPIGDIAYYDVSGLKVGLIAFSTGAGVYQVQLLEIARKIVADVDRTVDIVVVSFHGGAEGTSAAHVPRGSESFYGEDRGNLREFTHTVVDAGADLVIGHGPHLLRGMEIYKSRLIAYSMGNFSSWDTFNLTGPLGISAILHVELAANGVLRGAQIFPTFLEKPGKPRLDPKKQAISLIRSLSREDFGNPVLDENGHYELPGRVATHAANRVVH